MLLALQSEKSIALLLWGGGHRCITSCIKHQPIAATKVNHLKQVVEL